MEISDVPSNEMEANQPANPEIDGHNQPEEAGTEHVNSISVTLEDRFRTLMDSDASDEEEDKGHKPLIGQVSMLLGMKSELKKNFQPRIMSIGPLHYDERDIELKQGQKLKCQLAKLFVGKYNLSKEILYRNTLEEIESFKKYYDQKELLKKFHGNDEDLAWIFFVDGCALIQLVLCWFEDELYADDQMDLFITDLLLLDNQLPLEVLNLIIMGFSKEEEWPYQAKELRTLICRFIKIIATINFRRWEKGVKADSVSFNKANHLLGLIWMNLVKEETDCRSDNTKATSGHFGSVKDPQAAGIIVRPKNSSSSGDIPIQVIEGGGELHQHGHSVGKHSKELGKSINRLIKIILTTINIKRWEKGVKASPSFNKEADYRSEDNNKATSRQFRSVMDLQAAGIILEPSHPRSSLRDISFNRGFCFCKLKIPSFGVSEQGKFLLFNLIAFEMHPHFDKQDRVVTSYIRFLNSLVATKEDVAELRKVGILFNYLPNDEEVLNTFRELTSSLKPYADIFSCIKEELIDYFNDKKSMTTGKWLSEAMHVYFGSPWTTIAFVSASLVLILTIIQTVFSGLAYAQCR